jgi:Vacuolar sorting protein 39 domain 1
MFLSRARFAKSENFANLEDSVTFLNARSLFHVVALLYKSRNMLENALDIWQKLGTSVLIEEGQDGVTETIEALSESPNKALVITYAQWLLRLHPTRGMTVFVSRTKLRCCVPCRICVFISWISIRIARKGPTT